MINTKVFWMSRFHRLMESKSTWARLHRAEIYPLAFNPISSKAKSMCKNTFWKELYA